MNRLLVAAGSGLALLLGAQYQEGPAPAEAGTAVRMDVSELVGASDLVFEGRVLSQDVVENASGRIDTLLTLDVDRTYWGESQPTRTVRLPGGVLPDGRGMIVPGMARIVPGEDVLLMLAGDVNTLQMPVGLAQGKLRIVTNRYGEKSLVRSNGALSLVSPATGGVSESSGIEVMDYAEVVAEIESAVAARSVSPVSPVGLDGQGR